MREGRANGGADGEGGAAAAAATEGLLRRRRQPRSYSDPSSSGSAASSSSGRREGEEDERRRGGGKKQGRRKAVARAIRDSLSCLAPGSAGQGIGERSRRERLPGGDVFYDAVDRDDSSAGGSRASSRPAAGCLCICPAGDCSLEPNPSANGKEDAGLRALIESNDFYSNDCNPHASVSPEQDRHPF